MSVSAIPATLGGAAEFNVQNAMAAIALAFGHGISRQTICNAMSSFSSSYEQNPGRLNIYDGHGFRVIVDYAHNPAGLTQLCKVVERMRSSHNQCIGMISIPGDRRDEDIREMGRIGARFFDTLVFRERPDGRGRDPGEVNALLTEGALQGGFAIAQIHQLAGEEEATDFCLQAARDGDLVVLTPTNYEQVWEQMLRFVPHGQRSSKRSYG